MARFCVTYRDHHQQIDCLYLSADTVDSAKVEFDTQNLGKIVSVDLARKLDLYQSSKYNNR